ncbi:MAG TPA: Gfo/Idh/MocA family oxidoreductase [Terriglobales bacterium]|jgi:myo-inositol 2-dehydrogenase/D-chiro-inositol 1-dehydrogenase|nr:Gfo/Idh/MocA family oxidoreductase [Terriglobales bacterium]
MQVAVVGCGRMGRERALAAASFGVSAVLLFDEDVGRATSLANECPKARIVKESDAVFSEKINERIEALFICTPPFCRGPLELRAISSGIPFFVEKPIGVTVGQVQAILDALGETPVLTAVGYMNRYRNSVSLAKAILQSRKIIGITAHWAGKKYGVPWWGVIEQSGGPFNEQATHLMDLFRYLAEEVEPRFAAAHAPGGIETTVLAAMRLSGGGLGSFLYSCEAKEKDIFIVIETSEGMLELRGWDLDLVCNTIDGSRPEPESKSIFEKETHAFLQAVTTANRTFILADFEEAFQTQVLMDSVVRMIRPGVAIR